MEIGSELGNPHCYLCRDMLERNLSKAELTDLLTDNQQEIPSGVDKVRTENSRENIWFKEIFQNKEDHIISFCRYWTASRTR